MPDGKFSNSFVIGFNAYEFIFDFGMITATGASHIHSRVVTSPADAQEFVELLAKSIGEHQKIYGVLSKGQAQPTVSGSGWPLQD